MTAHPQRTSLGDPYVDRPEMPNDYGVPTDQQGLLPWSHVTERLERAKNFWVASVRPNGRPHAVPLWAVWLDGTLYLEGSPQTRHGRNIAVNPAISVHLESGDDVVILEGDVAEIKQPDHVITTRLAQLFRAKYQGYEPTPEGWDGGGLFALRVHKVLAWTKFPTDTTRFRFGGK